MSPKPTAADLPQDLLDFLRAGRRLEYEVEGSSIGGITLKGAGELVASVVKAYPGCQSIIDDPYFGLDGYYLVEVVDLVAEAEDYGTEGLFAWIIALQCFGCVDSEHGDVIVFRGVSWTEIAAEPLPFLDAQWGPGELERAFPWLYFPFQLHDTGELVPPYPSQCPLHQTPLTIEQVQKPALLEVLRRRHGHEAWLREYLATFPCSGVPMTAEVLLCCCDCRKAEDAWIQAMDDAIPILDVKPNEQGWIQCPGCGIRFSTADEHCFRDRRHWTCGQKVRLVTGGGS